MSILAGSGIGRTGVLPSEPSGGTGLWSWPHARRSDLAMHLPMFLEELAAIQGQIRQVARFQAPLHRVRRRSTAGLRASVNDGGRRAAWKYSGRHRHLQRVEITHLTLPAQKGSVQSFEHVKVIQDNGQPDSCLPKGRNRLSLRSQSEDGTKIRRLWPAARCRTAFLQAHAAHGSIPNSQKCLRQHCPACSCRSDYFRAARH